MSKNKISLHESGHGVLGTLTRLKISRITIVPDPNGDAFGRCDFEPAEQNVDLQCLVLLGGLAAQRFCGCEDADYKTQDDYITAKDKLTRAYHAAENEPQATKEEVEADLEKYINRGVEFLQEYEASFHALADALDAKQTLDGDEADDLVLGNLPPKQ